jgi:hypothetical protein
MPFGRFASIPECYIIVRKPNKLKMSLRDPANKILLLLVLGNQLTS